MAYTNNLIFNSIHKDWCICESEDPDIHGPEVILDFYNGDPDVLVRCTFSAQPLPPHEDKLKNCKNVIGPVEHPEINGQPLPHPPHLVPHTPPQLPPALPVCMPVCPAGTHGGTPVGQTSAGASALTIPSSPGASGLPENGREPSFHCCCFFCRDQLKLACCLNFHFLMHEIHYPCQRCYMLSARMQMHFKHGNA